MDKWKKHSTGYLFISPWLIGFAVLAARRPNVFGAVVGAIFVGVLLNGLTMLNVPYYTQDFVKGAVLVGALGLTYGLGRRPA